MPASRSRRRLVPLLAGLATLATAVAASAAGSSGSAAAGSAVSSTRHVYHAGTESTPSTEVGNYHGPKLTLAQTAVGAPGMEPTIGVAGDGTIYYGAAHLVLDTDVTWGGARTDTRMSTDGGATFKSIQPGFGDPGSVPPANADPMIYVDPTTGRVFNFDLETIATAKPTSIPTVGYPNVVYWCSNRVIDSTCGRSLDGGITWTATGTPAYLGFDPDIGDLSGGLTGHLAVDPDGRPRGTAGTRGSRSPTTRAPPGPGSRSATSRLPTPTCRSRRTTPGTSTMAGGAASTTCRSR